MSLDLVSIKDALVEIILLAKLNIFDKSEVTNIEQKSHQDYVTNLDYSLEEYLINNISNKFPDIKIYSEERIKDVVNIAKEKCFIIDPLDGTMNLLSGIPFYAISIAYLDNGIPQVGVIYDLSRNEMFHASVGGGLFINDKKLDQNLDITKKPLLVSNEFLSICIEKKPELISKIKKIAKIRILGAQSLHLAYVASGRLRMCLNFEAKIWDDAAGFVMIQEAGILYKNLRNENIFPKKIIDPKENLMSMAIHKEDIDSLISDLKLIF